jgi:hypothetical protein
MAEKNIAVTTVTTASPPVMVPTREFAKLTSLREIPPVSISAPAKIKKGIAINGNKSRAENILCTNTSKGILPSLASAIVEARPKEKATGTLKNNSINRVMNITAAISIHSP